MGLKRGVRVRGIFSTALARLLIDSGISVVDASHQLKERFGDEVEERGVALVTIKDRDDRGGLVVIGKRELTERVLEALRSVVTMSPVIAMREELYATYVCRVVEPSVVELPGGRLGSLDGSAKPGELIAAHVVAFREGKPLLRRGAALVGEFVRLIEGQPHDVSEHIRGARRSLLLSLAMSAGIEGWGVKWRSSARWAEMSELLDELQKLKDEAIRLKEVLREAQQPAKLTEGELLAFIPLSLDDKSRLDAIRLRQVPTIPLHHMLKACGDRYSNLVDEAERTLLRHCEPERLSETLLEEVLNGFTPGRLKLLHEKIDGKVAVLEGEGEILSRKPPTFKLVRRARSPGIYDGLGVAKEEGDLILSVAVLGSYALPHAYFDSSGRLKGVYVNVNTPIEPRPPDVLWYMDLCVDVTWTREQGVRIVDLEELRSYRGYLSEEAISYYEKLAENIAEKLSGLNCVSDVLKTLVELGKSFVSGPVAAVLSNGQQPRAL